MGDNLVSPNSLHRPCDLKDLSGWFAAEIADVSPQPVRTVLELMAEHLEDFVRWPAEAVLFWRGCDRVVPMGERTAGKRTKYYKYPEALKKAAKAAGVYLDRRVNGPAVAAFQIAGGDRPKRFGSLNAWSVHHLYSGKFPYPGRLETTHSVKECEHFTQSAGLVALHPIADAVCDESPAVTWLLRAEAFQRFGYDPDGVFSPSQDAFGFAPPRSSRVLHATA